MSAYLESGHEVTRCTCGGLHVGRRTDAPVKHSKRDLRFCYSDPSAIAAVETEAWFFGLAVAMSAIGVAILVMVLLR